MFYCKRAVSQKAPLVQKNVMLDWSGDDGLLDLPERLPEAAASGTGDLWTRAINGLRLPASSAPLKLADLPDL